MCNLLNKLFKNKEKEETLPKTGDIIIFDLILETGWGVYGPSISKIDRLQGEVEKVRDNVVKVNGKWYREGFYAGDILIREIITD